MIKYMGISKKNESTKVLNPRRCCKIRLSHYHAGVSKALLLAIRILSCSLRISTSPSLSKALFLAFWCLSLSLRSSDTTSGSFSLITSSLSSYLIFAMKQAYYVLLQRFSSELYGFYLALYACPILLVFLKLFSWPYEFCPALYVFLLHHHFLKLSS